MSAHNRLSSARSPYLRQHRDNPVHWWEWGDEAFAEAQSSGRPVLLSVGYAACHWCHVMAHESFEDPEIAALMNQRFVNIKVDREERPDVDQYYMSALHRLGQQGGWPMTMFLTPDRAPFWGGTYFPATPRYGQPSFPQVLNAIADTWANEPGKVEQNVEAIATAIAHATPAGSMPPAAPAAARLVDAFDPENGGMRGAPKFPQYPMLDFLWRAGGGTGRARVVHTLARIACGGIYDHVGGGFCRYSVDEKWLVPHFEKMLYDNALLIRLLARAGASTGRALFRIRIDETLGFLDRELRDGELYASSLDADSEGEEGRFYLWTPGELESVLGDRAEAFAAAYDVTEAGNFEGRSIPNLIGHEPGEAAAIREAHGGDIASLLKARAGRVRPGLDDKPLADWNAYLVTALADAAFLLGHPDYLERAEALFSALLPGPEAVAGLSHLAGSKGPVFSSDLASLLEAATALMQHGVDFADTAGSLVRRLEEEFASPEGLYSLAPARSPDLPATIAMASDDAVPNPNATAAMALIHLHRLTGNEHYREIADRLIEAAGAHAAAGPFGHLGMLAASVHRSDTKALTFLPATREASRSALEAATRKAADPNITLVIHGNNNLPAYFIGAESKAAGALLCLADRCLPPIQNPAVLAEALRSAGEG
ncbi:MAG: thioredoxin domain-containing protein [Flavobacteriaceae bacterium]